MTILGILVGTLEGMKVRLHVLSLNLPMRLVNQYA